MRLNGCRELRKGESENLLIVRDNIGNFVMRKIYMI